MRRFLAIWSSQSASVIGTALTAFAINIWVAQRLYPRPDQKPELAFALSALTVASTLTVFLAPIAGAWADRHDRRRTMVGMDLASGVLGIAIALLLSSGRMGLLPLVGLVFAYTALSQFHRLALDASYATVVPPSQLPRANGMMQTTFALSGIVAPALAAFLIGLPSVGWLAAGAPLAVAADAATFLLSAGALALTPIPSPARIGADRPSLWRDAGFGFGYILRRRPLLWLLAAFTAANFAGTFVTVYLPLLVRFNLAAPGLTFSDALALLTSVGSIGGLLGGAAVSAWGGLRNRRILGVLVPLIFLGAGQLAFGLSRSLYLAAAMLAVQFAAGPVANAHSHAIWQGQVPPALQGRVFAVRRLIAQFTAPAGAALAGWAGAAFNPGTVVAVLGVALAVFCLGLLFSQSLHRVEDRAWLDSLAL